MQDQGHNPAFEVTISEELRALILARNALVDAPEEDEPEDTNRSPQGKPVSVFSPRRFRVDGHQPVRVMATDLLTLHAEGGEDGDGEEGAGGVGCQRLSLLLTEDGECLAHVVLDPPEGSAARPTHRLERMEDRSDVLSLVQACQTELQACAVSGLGTDTRGADDTALHRLEQTSAQMAEALAPFVQNSRN